MYATNFFWSSPYIAMNYQNSLTMNYNEVTQFYSIKLIIEFTMNNKFWRCSPISFEHMSFQCMFLDMCLTMHCSNIGVQLR